MAVRAQDVQFYLSGGATNSVPNKSLGGVISSQTVVAEALLQNLFDEVSSGEASAGDTEYRCYFVKNTSASTWYSVEVWFGNNTPSSGTTFELALDAAGVGDGLATLVANESTEPDPGLLTWSAPSGSPGVSIGNIPAGKAQGIWLKRIVTAGVASAPTDGVRLVHSGTDA